MKKIIKLLLGLTVAFSPFLSFAYSTIPGCTSPSGLSTLTGESCATAIIAPVIKVVAPDTAESLERGSTYVIKWTSDNSVKPDSLVNIALIEDPSGSSGPYLATVKSRDGFMNSYTWTIPENTAPGKYRIFIFYEDFNDSVDTAQCIHMNYFEDKCLSNKSSVPFSIIEKKPPAGTSIALLSPNGGEQITAGTFLKIHWKQERQYHMPPVAKVFLDSVSGPWAGSKKLVDDYVEDFDGASVYIDPSTPPGSYRIWIEDVDFSSIFDKSDTPITIVAGIKTTQFPLISPNGGESWQHGGTYKLKWKVVPIQGGIKSITVSFFDENLTQSFYSTARIATSTNSGVTGFTLPAVGDDSEFQPGKYKVAIGFNCPGWFAEYDMMRNACPLFGVSAKAFTVTKAGSQASVSQPLAIPGITTSKSIAQKQATSINPGQTSVINPSVEPASTIPAQATTATSATSKESVVSPTTTPAKESILKGFLKSVGCFFSRLFGEGCR